MTTETILAYRYCPVQQGYCYNCRARHPYGTSWYDRERLERVRRDDELRKLLD